MKCRFCKLDSDCDHILTIENQPPSAQGFFDNQAGSYQKVDLEVYECSQCGLIQHNSTPVFYYKDVIRAIAYSAEMKHFRSTQLRKWLGDYQLWDKNILEIGAGKGEYLDLLDEAGAKKLHGLEHSSQNFIVLKDKKYNSRRGFLDATFKNSWDLSFDAVVSFNFVEHWPDLRVGLTEIKKLLTDEGVGLIEVPNFDHMLEHGIYSEFTLDHIYYFTEETFRNVLQGTGFEVISISSIWKGYILSAKVRKRKKANMRAIIESKKKNSQALVEHLSNYKGSVVVWGAGHQALSLMAMIQADNYVKYVVDSAPFKQGKFCPVTGLKIFPPAQLSIDCPQCIVVMGAGYSDEIVKIIHNDFGNVEDLLIVDASGVRKVND
tara:strand:- start:134 stop:1264 length:1131 start_codon:yes stop_codon:yes gene_type:complete